MRAVVGQIAQLVEQGIENPRVGGSIPSLATISASNIVSVEGMHRSYQSLLHGMYFYCRLITSAH